MDEDFASRVIERLGALGRVKIVAIGVAAALLMSTGLAVAQVDTGPPKPKPKKIAGVLGVDIRDGKVTHGTDRYYGGDCLPIADGKGAANHGQYLKWVRTHHPDQLDAAKASKCGKPLTAGQDDDNDADDQKESVTTTTTSAPGTTTTTTSP